MKKGDPSGAPFFWQCVPRSASFREGENFFSKRVGPAAQSGHKFALFVHQELVEIPTHVVVARTVQFFLGEPGVDRVLFVTFHIHLGHHEETHAVVPCAEFTNVRCRARLLTTKLVAREAQDDKVLVFTTLVQRFEGLVLRRVATTGRRVHNHHALSFEVCEGERFAFKGFSGQVMKRGHGGCGLVPGAGVECFPSDEPGSSEERARNEDES